MTDEEQIVPKKKISIWKIIIISFLLLLLVGAVSYAWIKVKHPDWLEGDSATPAPPSSTGISKTTIWVIGLVVLGGILILVFYLIFRGRSRIKGNIESPKQPISPDRAEALFKEHFCKKNHVECVFNYKEKVYQPANRNAIMVADRLPYFHTVTGDNFWLIEIEVREGDQQGIHTVVIPIDKGEEIIKGGYYRLDTQVPKFQFRLNKNVYPMSSSIDKQERLRMAVLEQAESGEEATEMIRTITPASPVTPTISTPLEQMDDLGGGEIGGGVSNLSAPRRPYQRRRYAPYRRRY